LKANLLDGPKSIPQLKDLIQGFADDSWTVAITKMVDDGIISFDEQGRLCMIR
jgi:hypothetical protein